MVYAFNRKRFFNQVYTTVSFINVTTCVKLCLKVNLRILATRLVFVSFFIADELQFISVHEHESSSGLRIRLSHYQHFLLRAHGAFG